MTEGFARPGVAVGVSLSVGSGGSVGIVHRCPPQRVTENPDGTAGRPNVLDLPRGNPIVDGATRHADDFARLPDRERLTIHCVLS